jgi:ATP-binding cassette subfamily B protein
MERASERVQRDISEMSTFSQEHLTTIRMFKAYGQEEQMVRAFEASNQSLARSNLRFMVLSGVISPVPGSVVRLTAALVLGIGGALVIQNALTRGQLVEFIVYLTLLSTAAMQISSAFLRMLQGAASAGRVGEVLHHEPHVRNAPDAVKTPIRGDVAMEDVTVRAAGAAILKDINFSVPAGTTVGVVGPTGAGKSTLLRLIPRVQDPSAGRVLIDGIDARRIDLGCLRGAVATVPQESFLFGMTLRDNITLGLEDVPEETLDRAVTTARLSNDMPQFPKGLDTLVGERGATLSGGQKQRTAIARALVRDPRILILDDAMASVDARTASQIVEGLARGAAGRRTTFIVTQHLPAIRHADHILVLDRGEIVERGTHQELLARGGLYATMYAREHDSRAEQPANGRVEESLEVRA